MTDSRLLAIVTAILLAVSIFYIGRLRRDLRVAQKKSRQAKARLHRFIRSVGHEIGDPLQVIHGMAELVISQTASPATRRDHALILSQAVDHLQWSSLNLLRFFAADDGYAPASERVDLPSLLNNLREAWRPLAIERGVGIHVQFEDGAPRIVDADLAHLRQLVGNVLGHALSLSPYGSDVTVRVKTYKAEVVELEVTDSAKALSPEAIDAAFEPFGLEEHLPGVMPSGMGLNLYIARQIAQMMSGTVSLRPEPPSGQAYVLALPLHVHYTVSAGDRRGGVVVSFPNQTPKREFDVGPRSVLLVEDSVGGRKTLHAVLSEAGHDVTVAGDVERALDQVERREFDLILSDYRLPGRSGLDLMHLVQLASSGRNRHTPFIIMTGEASPHLRTVALEAGATDFLRKPVATRQLLQAIADAVTKKDAGRTARPGAPATSDTDIIVGVDNAAAHDGVIPRRIAYALGYAMLYVGEMQLAADREDWVTVQLRARAVRGAAHMIGAPRVVKACTSIIESPRAALAMSWPSMYVSLSRALDEARTALGGMFASPGMANH